MKQILFFDTEVANRGKQLVDIGAIKSDNKEFHAGSRSQFIAFANDCDYLCGHNIFAHDLQYLGDDLDANHRVRHYIDTLLLSPLLFPERPYHHLVKDDKLQSGELNNPFFDACKARDLFNDEVTAFNHLPASLQAIYYLLLYRNPKFKSFFDYLDYSSNDSLLLLIRFTFNTEICLNSNLVEMIQNHPTELAYCLALINTRDRQSIIPPWVSRNYPEVNDIMDQLRNRPCNDGCPYCNSKLNIHSSLQHYFGYPSFRRYNGEPLQENAVKAAVRGESLLAIFPTGGGKSLTFQLPALMAGDAVRGLTVVISPLQSLMKDQVDNLEKKGIVDAVTINGLLNPIERANAIKRVSEGSASILYISPESLRSATVERLLLSRNVVRFVIDEAHCFSAWGQDFRVDYLFIGDYLRQLQEKKGLANPIPVSCFTATAKPKVISDILDYFQDKLGIELQRYTTSATRENLQYRVFLCEDDEKKYVELRRIIQAHNCPSIVYVSRTKKTEELASRLTQDGFPALPFHGKMETQQKVENQDAFMAGRVNIIVATSAFGMGVDKDNVGLVVHYNISDSLENYVQEAGRAGRNESIQADCYVLFNDEDLDNHFSRLAQSKLSIDEIKQIWSAVKKLSGQRGHFTLSPLEIARSAGWDASGEVSELETRIKAGVAALENAGYLTRGMNVPHVYASGILVNNLAEAASKIDSSVFIPATEKETAKRIMTALMGGLYRDRGPNKQDNGVNRVDVLADALALEKEKTLDVINMLRASGILADSEDMSAHIAQSDSEKKKGPNETLRRASAVERFILENPPQKWRYNDKELSDSAQKAGIRTANVKYINDIITYWKMVGVLKEQRSQDDEFPEYKLSKNPEELLKEFEKRQTIAGFIIRYLLEKVDNKHAVSEVPFSILELQEEYKNDLQLFDDRQEVSANDIKDALLYLDKIHALDLDGGFLVFYSAIHIQRLEMNNNIKYKKDDYLALNAFYAQKTQQIHIVGKYAHMLTRSPAEAKAFANDYFQMDYMLFIDKYFKGDERDQINLAITAEKHNKIFGSLSATQRQVIRDKNSKYIVVCAGPGSGKTKLLVHKLASLLLLEDTKGEQLLMLTFSRSAATEFKSRLIDLIGNAAYYVEIKTFHSYCFDLLGKIGSLEESSDVVQRAADLIRSDEVDIGRITKTVLVIDEAQDIDEHEFSLIQALIARNEDMRIIAVGDDDQNIYEFRGSDSKYMRSLITDYQAAQYELVDNYRSARSIVALANRFSKTIVKRMKTEPIFPVRKEEGTAALIRYDTQNLDVATVDLLQNTYQRGTCCILTATNEEALRVTGILTKRGYQAHLIQSNDGFNLRNLLEIRTFLQLVGIDDKSPTIPQDIWEASIERLSTVFHGSTCLPECLNMLSRFKKTNRELYKTDLLEFISESNLEDFVVNPKGSIVVSTIHKSKGREFDSVYIMLDNYRINSDKERHALYVGITRAKNNLFVNYNNNLFDRVTAAGVLNKQNHAAFPESGEVLMQISHRGMNLGYFQDKQDRILKLQSGTPLILDGDYLLVDYGRYKAKVGRLSKACASSLSELVAKGYRIVKAEVRFLVYWKPKDAPEESESLIILPDIYLNKR